MTPDKNNSTNRFFILFLLLCAVGVYILSTAAYTTLTKRDYWMAVSKRFGKENIPLPTTRGNIYDCKGRLMAGSVPEYRLYIDYEVLNRNISDSMFYANLDTIAEGLANIFPDYRPTHKETADHFRKLLKQGKKTRNRSWRVYPHNASYIQYKQCIELPIFDLHKYKGGFYGERIMYRKHPYGSLAERTIGSLRASNGDPKNGLELSFDSILAGKPGVAHSTKMRNKYVQVVDLEPVPGNDLLTTIDVDIQDMAEKALVSKLKEELVHGILGMAVVMEVATGEVKAIVNMHRGQDGNYYELKNSVVSDLMEPGSTFKTASMMLAMDEGKASLNTTVDCAGGMYPMHGRVMKDHNWHRGGYGVLTFSQILENSSNIGVSRIIDENYRDNPQAYVDGLRRMGIGLPLNLPFAGKGEPLIPQPNSKTRYWSKSDLPWMSIGYVTQQPVISTLTFYNAIANGGKMVKPKFVKAELKDGKIVREFPTEVLKEQICKPSTLKNIQFCLNNVVSIGLGKRAGNGGKLFQVSGKTGTAQVACGKDGYHNGTRRYMVSFCGFFPSEAPKYSCIVCIVKDGLPASGGGQCGPVFSQISQYVMAQGVTRGASEMADSTSVFTPSYKNTRDKVQDCSLDVVPDVHGMGAKDAVFVLERRGIKVSLHGTGSVRSQSVTSGTKVTKGMSVRLSLE